MIVTAVRDDGALLVTTGDRAFLVTGPQDVTAVLAQSVLARGVWDDPGDPPPLVPPAARTRIAAWPRQDLGDSSSPPWLAAG